MDKINNMRKLTEEELKPIFEDIDKNNRLTINQKILMKQSILILNNDLTNTELERLNKRLKSKLNEIRKK